MLRRKRRRHQCTWKLNHPFDLLSNSRPSTSVVKKKEKPPNEHTIEVSDKNEDEDEEVQINEEYNNIESDVEDDEDGVDGEDDEEEKGGWDNQESEMEESDDDSLLVPADGIKIDL